MAVIEIRDKDYKGLLTVNLIDILNNLPSNCHKLKWFIYEVECTGDLSGLGLSVIAFEEEINNSKTGTKITWEKLYELAKSFYQVVNITIVAFINDRDNKTIKQVFIDKKYLLSIECIDSSLWQLDNRASLLDTKEFLSAFSDVSLLK